MLLEWFAIGEVHQQKQHHKIIKLDLDARILVQVVGNEGEDHSP